MAHWDRLDNVTTISPTPRIDTSIVFSKDNKLFFFGGWCSKHRRWKGDIYSCDLSDVVGPPYNIFSIKASDWNSPTSPITGGVDLTIQGQGFRSLSGGGSSSSVVKFACPSGCVETNGDVVSDTQIVCKAPDFTNHGSVEEVDVTVKIGPGRFTNNALPFHFFTVADSSKTVAFGPGLLDGVKANEETVFVIQAVDENGQPRTCGMDKFTVLIRELLEEQPEEPKEGESHHMSLPKSSAVGVIVAAKLIARAMRVRRRMSDQLLPFSLEDCHDGTYVCRFTPPQNGYYKIDVNFVGTFQVGAGVDFELLSNSLINFRMPKPATSRETLGLFAVPPSLCMPCRTRAILLATS